tara:strand:- start:5274 stop:6272 length:999 start_codon:yes stop_codon:yes gene_type:complete
MATVNTIEIINISATSLTYKSYDNLGVESSISVLNTPITITTSNETSGDPSTTPWTSIAGISFSGISTPALLKNSTGTNNVRYITQSNIGSSSGTNVPIGNSISLSVNMYIGYDNSTVLPPPPVTQYKYFFKVVQLCIPNFTLIPTTNGLIKAEDLKRGDIVMTNDGPNPLVKTIKTINHGKSEYVKIPKNIFSKDLPSDNVYITSPHSFSLGVYKNADLHNGEHQTELDDLVHLHIQANEFLKHEGIKLVKLDTPSYYNLVFDNHQYFNVYNMKIMSHHPNGNPIIIDKKLEINNMTNKKCIPVFSTWEEFLNKKPKEQSLENYFIEKLKF